MTTNASGIAVLSLTSIQAQNVTVSAAAGGKSGQTTAAFTAISVSTVAVTMTTNNSPADGTTQNVAQAVVTGADGKPLKGVNVTWSIGGSATGTSPLNVTTNASGIAVLSLTSIQAQNVTVSAAAGGKSGQTTAAFIEVPAEKATDITFDSTGQGNRSDPGVITATVVGKSGTGIAGVSVTWNYPANSFLICAAPSSVTNSKGQVSISCYATSGNVADQPFNVRVDANASQDPTNPVTRTFTRDFRI
ncbi:Ig-like domain-containing protein [Enterobacter ludwigii]